SIFFDGLAGRSGKFVEFACVWRRQQQGPRLGANDVIRRHRTRLAKALNIATTHIIENFFICPMLEQESCPARLVAIERNGDESSQQRGNVPCCNRRPWQLDCMSAPLMFAPQTTLGETHELDHALVSFARGMSESENAVLMQDQSLAIRIGVEHLFSFQRE